MGRIISRLLDFFYESGGNDAPKSPSKDRPDAAPDPKADAFERELVAGARAAAHVPVVLIQVIGVADARRKLGPKWAAVSHHVNKLADAIIHRHLRPGDTYTTADSDAYLVYFADTDPGEAKTRAGKIGGELLGLLLSVLPGDTGLSIDAKQIGVAAGSSDDADDLQPAGPPEHIAVDAPTDAVHAAPKPAALNMLSERPATRIDNETVQRIQQKAATLFSNIEPHYRRIWQSGRGRESLIECLLLKREGKQETSGEELYPRNDTGVLATDLDMTLAAAAITESQKLLDVDDGRTWRLVIPIHFGVLVRAENRDQLLNMCDGLKRATGDIVIVQLVCLGSGFTTARLSDVVSFTRRLPGRVSALLPPDPRSLDGFENQGMESVWTDAASAERKAIVAFAGHAKRIGARTGLRNVDHTETFEMAQRAGYVQMSGGAIGMPVKQALQIV